MTKRHVYTKEEYEFLLQHYPEDDWNIILQHFPDCSKHAISSYCNKKNIKRNVKNLNKIINNINTSSKWTKEEDDILQKYYSKLPIGEIMKMLPNRSKNAIGQRANKQFNLISYNRLSQTYTIEELNFIKNNWEQMSDVQLASILNKTPRAIKAKRGELKLYRQDLTHTSYSYDDLNKYLRGNIWQWRLDSQRQCNYCCVLSGSQKYEIHHIYSFHCILNEFIKKNNIILKTFDEYSKDELQEIAIQFQKFHAKFPLGVCIDKKLHKLFHYIYGKKNNEQQWEEFVNLYKKGELTVYLSA